VALTSDERQPRTMLTSAVESHRNTSAEGKFPEINKDDPTYPAEGCFVECSMKGDDDSVKVASQSHQPISLQVNNGLTSMRRVSTRAQARLEEKSEMAQGEAVHDTVDVGAPSVSNRREHARHTLKFRLWAMSVHCLAASYGARKIMTKFYKLLRS
jgi:hypothetical protein